MTGGETGGSQGAGPRVSTVIPGCRQEGEPIWRGARFSFSVTLLSTDRHAHLQFTQKPLERVSRESCPRRASVLGDPEKRSPQQGPEGAASLGSGPVGPSRVRLPGSSPGLLPSPSFLICKWG